MKSLDSRFTISRLIVFAITVSIFAGQTMVALAIPKAGQPAGELTVKGKNVHQREAVCVSEW